MLSALCCMPYEQDEDFPKLSLLTWLQFSRLNSCAGVALSNTGLKISQGMPPTQSMAGRKRHLFFFSKVSQAPTFPSHLTTSVPVSSSFIDYRQTLSQLKQLKQLSHIPCIKKRNKRTVVQSNLTKCLTIYVVNQDLSAKVEQRLHLCKKQKQKTKTTVVRIYQEDSRKSYFKKANILITLDLKL